MTASLHESIGGLNTYYRKVNSGYVIVNYVFVKGDKAVHINARTYDPHELQDGTLVGDFRKFEPQIAEMAKSIKF